jgi:hypothetical protein
MPNPISQDAIDRELRYAMALGIVESFRAKPTRGGDGAGYRRFTVLTSDGDAHIWTPAQVMAFAVGVRLATERKGT